MFHRVLSIAESRYNTCREAGQTVAGPRRKVVDGRKVRTPQSGVTVNGRPLKSAGASQWYKARNRATETSVLSYGETR